eukprot:6152047-Prymnesium_polylepis.2
MRTALEREGRTALSVDLRPCELGGMHAQLDVRLILPLRHWERAFLFPPCFQQLRQDQDCLPLKIADGRAYWGCATVSGARVRRRISSLLSSPIQYSLTAGRALSQACAHRKLSVAGKPGEPVRDATRSQHQFNDPEERDRARSTWLPFTGLSAALAHLEPSGQSTATAFHTAIESFAGPPSALGLQPPARRPTHRRCQGVPAAAPAGDHGSAHARRASATARAKARSLHRNSLGDACRRGLPRETSAPATCAAQPLTHQRRGRIRHAKGSQAGTSV